MNNYPDTQNVGSEFIFLPEGRYEQYQKKLQKLVDARNFVIKHKIAFILLGILLIAILLAFTICRGIFIGGISCPDLTYGDSFSPSANAFFCRVDYEYSSDGKNWSFEEPTLPGEYKVRGVSVNPFGTERRSFSTAFILYPRNAKVSLLYTSVEYGLTSDSELSALYTAEKNTLIEGLAKGDSISQITSTYTHNSWNSITASAPTVRIVNEKGVDVTSSYILETNGNEIGVYPRSVTVTTVGGEKLYDALPWSDATYSITSGSLSANDRLVISFPIYPAEPGLYTITPEVLRVENDFGEDISERYNITLDKGAFRVKRIPLVFSTPSAEKIYDETPLSLPEWTHESGELRPNHTLTVTSNNDKITNAGSQKNTLTVIIEDDLGENAIQYYDVTVKEGTLTVKPIVLKFSTGSAEKVYDGNSLVNFDYEHLEGELFPGHKMYPIHTTGSITDVGTAKNTLLVQIFNKDGDDVTSLAYKIEVNEGTLKVTPRPITVTSEDAEKVYDGTPLTHHVAHVTEGSLINHHYISYDFSGEQTEVGESENTFDVKSILRINLSSALQNGSVDVTKNYEITYVYGTLTVLPNTNQGGNSGGGGGGGGNGTGTGGDPNGGINTGGTKIEVPPEVDINNPPLVAEIFASGVGNQAFWAYLRASSFGDYNGSGFDAATPYTEITNKISPIDYTGLMYRTWLNTQSKMTVKRYEYCPVLVPYYSYNTNVIAGFDTNSDVMFESDLTEYTIDFVFRNFDKIFGDDRVGGMSNNQARYEKYVYNTYLQIPDSTKEELLKLAKENGIDPKSKMSQRELVQAIQDYVMNAGVYNLEAAPYPEGVDVAVYFLSTAKEGICQHYAAAATMLYRACGIPARYTVGFAVLATPEKNVEVTALNAHAWVEIYLDGKGWVPVEVTGEGSPMRPTKQKITVTSYSITKEYDAQSVASFAGEKFVISSGKLLPGHTIEVVVNDNHPNAKTSVGEYENTITSVRIYDTNGIDVTETAYDIKLNHGSTVIRKRQITIVLGSASKIYDGTPLTCDDWTLVSGSLVGGHELKLTGIPQAVEVGVIENTASVTITASFKLDSDYDIVIPGLDNTYSDVEIPDYTVSIPESGIFFPVIRDVTDLYEVTIIPGTLEILPAD